MTSTPLGAELQVFEDVRGDTTIAEITSPALADNFRRHAHAHLVCTNGGNSRACNFQCKAVPAFDAAAISIGALVDVGIQELLNQVAIRSV